jgi:hypothetical protein
VPTRGCRTAASRARQTHLTPEGARRLFRAPCRLYGQSRG